MTFKIYANLTNGLELANTFAFDGYVRIQSSHGEVKEWNKIIEDLDYSFLLDLAQGYKIAVVDASQKKKQSRAIYQCLPWIKFCLQITFYEEVSIPFVKTHNCLKYFSKQYKNLSEKARKKLNYIKKFLNTDEIYLSGYCVNTKHDGDYEYFKKILLEAKRGIDEQKIPKISNGNRHGISNKKA